MKTTRQTTLKLTILCQIDDSMLFKKPYNKPLINLDRLVIAGKYQTSVYYVRIVPLFFFFDLSCVIIC